MKFLYDYTPVTIITMARTVKRIPATCSLSKWLEKDSNYLYEGYQSENLKISLESCVKYLESVKDFSNLTTEEKEILENLCNTSQRVLSTGNDNKKKAHVFDGPIMCQLCGHLEDDINELMLHRCSFLIDFAFRFPITKFILNYRTLFCEECTPKKKFSSFKELEKHFLSHSVSPIIFCSTCRMHFPANFQLYEHHINSFLHEKSCRRLDFGKSLNVIISPLGQRNVFPLSKRAQDVFNCHIDFKKIFCYCLGCDELFLLHHLITHIQSIRHKKVPWLPMKCLFCGECSVGLYNFCMHWRNCKIIRYEISKSDKRSMDDFFVQKSGAPISINSIYCFNCFESTGGRSCFCSRCQEINLCYHVVSKPTFVSLSGHGLTNIINAVSLHRNDKKERPKKVVETLAERPTSSRKSRPLSPHPNARKSPQNGNIAHDPPLTKSNSSLSSGIYYASQLRQSRPSSVNTHTASCNIKTAPQSQFTQSNSSCSNDIYSSSQLRQSRPSSVNTHTASYNIETAPQSQFTQSKSSRSNDYTSQSRRSYTHRASRSPTVEIHSTTQNDDKCILL